MPRRALGVLAALVLSACAQPTAPPVLSLEGRGCGAAPSLADAQTLSLGSGSPSVFQPDPTVTVVLDATTPCFAVGDTASAYVVFALPETAEPYVVGVTVAPLGQSLLSPRLLVLDASGAVLRERPRDAFEFHGPSLYAGIRAYPSDRFLVVASDAPTVGQQHSQLVGQTQSTPICGMPGCFYVNTGSERRSAYVSSHNGRVTVGARQLPKVN